MRTIVYTHGGGRLGNQVLRWAHWLSWIWDHPGDFAIVNVAFWPYASLFSGSVTHPGCAEPNGRLAADILARLRAALPVTRSRRLEGRLYPALHTVVSRLPGVQSIALDDATGAGVDLDGPGFAERVKDHAFTFCSGWRIAGWSRFENHASRLQAYFQPTYSRIQGARRLLGEFRRGSEIVVGVLIRQTDYKDWHDGRFFFSTQQYVQWMRQLVDLNSGRRIAFMVASDARQDPDLFQGLKFRFSSGSVNAGGKAIDSLVELSMCDSILTPPSTFSAAAAFVGGIGLWPLVKAEQDLKNEQLIAGGLLGASRHPVFSLAVK